MARVTVLGAGLGLMVAMTPAVASPAPASPASPAFTRIPAPPGGVIKRLGVAPTGDAAITIDEADEVRLWPTLDGTQEPVVVDLPAGTAVAVTRTADGFAVALGLDGGSLVARVGADGHVQSHSERGALTGVAAVGDGFVAWHGRTLETFDASGATRSTVDLRAPVTSIVAAPGASPHAAAIAIVGGAPRWLDVAPLALGGAAPRPTPAITAKGSDLVIGSGASARYLGYAFPANRGGQFVVGDADHLVYNTGTRWLRLDRTLGSVAEVTPWAPAGDRARAMTWLGGDDWFVDCHAGVLIDQLTAGTGRLALPTAWVTAYEPGSQLVMLEHRHLARYHSDTGTVEAVAFSAWGSNLTETSLISPVVAGGPVLVQSERSYVGHDHLTMTWIHDVDHPEHGATSVRLEDVYQTGRDADGHVLVAPMGDRDAGQAYFDGQPDGHPHPTAQVATPDGQHYLEAAWNAGNPTTRLVDLTGRTLWGRPLDSTALRWLDRTHLAYTPVTGGMAMVNLATGDLESPRSGWGFELGVAPHVTSTVGRPLARALARQRDPDLQLTGNATFQTLVRGIATASGTRILEWGHATLDGQATRIALLKRPGETGVPLFAYVFESAPGEAREITISGWGFSEYQGVDEPAQDPPWGTAIEPESGLQHNRTIDRTTLSIGTKWIHGSFETIEISLSHREPVLASDSWVERENNGHGFDESHGGHTYAHNRPPLDGYKLHAIKVRTSAASKDPAELAAGIVELALPDSP